MFISWRVQMSVLNLNLNGERCELPQRVWGEAPATNDFGAFQTKKEAFGAI